MVVLHFYFVIFVVIFLNDVISYNPLLTYMVRYQKIDFYPNLTSNYAISERKGIQYVNGNFTLNTTLLADNVVVIIHRCDPEGIDCEYFQTWKFHDLCSKLLQKNQIWSSVYDAMTPPLVCPLNKINYQMKDGFFDLSQGIKFYSDIVNYQWKVWQKLYAGDTFLGGYMVKAFAFGYRKKRPGTGQH